MSMSGSMMLAVSEAGGSGAPASRKGQGAKRPVGSFCLRQNVSAKVCWRPGDTGSLQVGRRSDEPPWKAHEPSVHEAGIRWLPGADHRVEAFVDDVDKAVAVVEVEIDGRMACEKAGHNGGKHGVAQRQADP